MFVMKREDFVILTVSKQVELVNIYLAQGKSMIDIFKRERIIEIDESSVRKKFVKNGFIRDKENNQYIKIEGYNEVPKECPKSNSVVNKDNNKITRGEYPQSIPRGVLAKEYADSNTLVVPKEKTERLLKLVDQQPELEELLNWWRKEKDIIDIPDITLNKMEFTGEIVGKTFKTYKNVISKFLEFCDKHDEYTQRDLVAMALLEYLQKYK